MAQTRILDSDHALLQELAASTGKQHQEIIHEALEAFHRDRMLDEINAAFAAVKRDGTAWREEQSERLAWDGAGVNDPVCAQRWCCPSTSSTTARRSS